MEPLSIPNAGSAADATPSAPRQKVSAPIGADPVTPQTDQGASPVAPGSMHGSASPVDLSDDTMVRIPGQDQPVRYGELYKRLQADHTKKTQEAAKLRTQLQKEQTEWQTRRQQEQQTLQNTAAALLARQQGNAPGGQAGNDFLSQLEARPYVDGKTVAQIVRTMQQEGFGNVVKAIQERDTVIRNMYGQMSAMQNTLQQLAGVHQGSALDSRISQVLQELDIPAEAASWAKEIYSAYEGEDLDTEFPQILQERWTQLEAIQRKRDQQRIESAKRGQFALPGRGGNGSASKPIQMRGDESAREMADVLWDKLGVTERT